jgi:molybdopterin molybdotransferase
MSGGAHQGLLGFDEALAMLLAGIQPLALERVPLYEADGRVLATDLVAPYPLPPVDYSAMDGYALALADLEAVAARELVVIGESAAGGERPTLKPASTCRIFTGAPLPSAADTVVMQENVETFERDGARWARFAGDVRANANIRRRGEDLAEGSVAIRRGTRLDPGKIALAAALDRGTLAVSQRPVVTVLGTGDELRSPGEPGGPSSVVESNGFFVSALAKRAGAYARLGSFVPDDEGRAREAVATALESCDVLVTIGGVSVGNHDVVRPALLAAGVTIDVYKVAMKPGKPITLGRRGRQIVIGLPGNPASASLTFMLFGVPLLRALSGDREPIPRRRRMRVRGHIRREPGRMEFARAVFDEVVGEPCARLLPNQASGAVTSFAQAEALVVVPASHSSVVDGETLDVIAIGDVC